MGIHQNLSVGIRRVAESFPSEAQNSSFLSGAHNSQN